MVPTARFRAKNILDSQTQLKNAIRLGSSLAYTPKKLSFEPVAKLQNFFGGNGSRGHFATKNVASPAHNCKKTMGRPYFPFLGMATPALSKNSMFIQAARG